MAARRLVDAGATFRATEASGLATVSSYLGLVYCLAELGADVNYIRGLKDPDWDSLEEVSNPLHKAVKSGQSEILGLFISYRADPQLRDMSSKIAKDLAS